MTPTEKTSASVALLGCLGLPLLSWMGAWIWVLRIYDIALPLAVPGGIVLGLLIGGGVMRLSGRKVVENGCTTIPILLAFLVMAPVFKQARQRAQMLGCKKNLTQLAAGFSRYKADHDGQLPPEKSWEAALAKYVPAKAFVCPTSKRGYHYEVGRNRRLLTEAPQCHGEWSMALFTEGRVKALKLRLPPTPSPALLARQ